MTNFFSVPSNFQDLKHIYFFHFFSSLLISSTSVIKRITISKYISMLRKICKCGALFILVLINVTFVKAKDEEEKLEQQQQETER
jgi:hypothetical protein